VHLVATRTYTDAGTTGFVSTEARSFFSIEQPWRNNQQGHSCIPEGDYDLVYYLSPKHGPTYCFRNPDLKIMGCDTLTPEQIAEGYRTLCELHSANFPEQLEGCMALGLEGRPMYDPATGVVEVAVEDSKPAIAALMEELGVGVVGHTMSIHSPTGVPSNG
jgi:hypothetical protein